VSIRQGLVGANETLVSLVSAALLRRQIALEKVLYAAAEADLLFGDGGLRFNPLASVAHGDGR
jgi:hypothetical protein